MFGEQIIIEDRTGPLSIKIRTPRTINELRKTKWGHLNQAMMIRLGSVFDFWNKYGLPEQLVNELPKESEENYFIKNPPREPIGDNQINRLKQKIKEQIGNNEVVTIDLGKNQLEEKIRFQGLMLDMLKKYLDKKNQLKPNSKMFDRNKLGRQWGLSENDLNKRMNFFNELMQYGLSTKLRQHVLTVKVESE